MSVPPDTRPGSHPFQAGDRVRVLPQFDIPPLLRGGAPSEGIIDHLNGDVLIVVVDGQSVPYEPHEVERV